MEELTFLEERDEALFVAYKNALRQPDCKSHQQAITMAINSPTSRFWISSRQGYREILLMNKNIRPPRIRSKRQQMLAELYGRYQRLCKSPLFRGSSVFFVSQFAINQPASSFYISYITASRIIHRKMKERRLRV